MLRFSTKSNSSVHIIIMSEPRFAHIAFRCSDINRSRDFYTNALGWRFFDYRPNSESMDLTDGFINVTLLPYEDDGTRSVMEEGHEFIHLGVIVDDLEAEHQRFTGLGVEPRKIVEFKNEDELLAKFFFLQDPDGYKIEILQKYGHYV